MARNDKLIVLSVVVAEGSRPVPSRTRKLSPPAPMVLHSPGCGRVGRRRHQTSVQNAPPGDRRGILHFRFWQAECVARFGHPPVHTRTRRRRVGATSAPPPRVVHIPLPPSTVFRRPLSAAPFRSRLDRTRTCEGGRVRCTRL